MSTFPKVREQNSQRYWLERVDHLHKSVSQQFADVIFAVIVFEISREFVEINDGQLQTLLRAAVVFNHTIHVDLKYCKQLIVSLELLTEVRDL